MIRYTNSNQLTDNPSLCVHIVSKDEKYLCTKEEKRWLSLGCSFREIELLGSAINDGNYADFGETINQMPNHRVKNDIKPKFWDFLPNLDCMWSYEAKPTNFYIAESLLYLSRNGWVIRHPERPYPSISTNDDCDIIITYEDHSIVIPYYYDYHNYHEESDDENTWVFMGMINMLGRFCAVRDGVRLTNRQFIEFSAGYEGE